MPKRAIPSVPKSSLGSDRSAFDVAVKENLEVLLGQRGERIEALPNDTSNADIIIKINELIALLQ